MSIRRYQVYDNRRQAVFPFGPVLPVPNVPSGIKENVADRVSAEEQAKVRLTTHAGNDTSFVQFGSLNPIRFPALGAAVDLVTFQVPEGRTLVVHRVAWWMSEPFCYGNGQFGWRLTTNDAQVPFQGSQNFVDDTELFAPLDSLGGDPEIPPVYVQANATFAVEVRELTGFTTFDNYLAVACWVIGTLLKPTGGALG